jgi:hypothetical protein
VFVPRTSSTLVATWFWQTEGISAEPVILGVRPSSSCLGSHPVREELPFTPPLWLRNQSFSLDEILSEKDLSHLLGSRLLPRNSGWSS